MLRYTPRENCEERAQRFVRCSVCHISLRIDSLPCVGNGNDGLGNYHGIHRAQDLKQLALRSFRAAVVRLGADKANGFSVERAVGYIPIERILQYPRYSVGVLGA